MVDKSDFSNLEELAATYCKARPRAPAYRKWLETAFVLFGLVGGGFGLGHYLGVNQGDAEHYAEIDRLREAYRLNIYVLTSSVQQAGTAVKDAAVQVEAAAAVADMAAGKAKEAARSAKQAVKPAQATQASSVKIDRPAAQPEPASALPAQPAKPTIQPKTMTDR